MTCSTGRQPRSTRAVACSRGRCPRLRAWVGGAQQVRGVEALLDPDGRLRRCASTKRSPSSTRGCRRPPGSGRRAKMRPPWSRPIPSAASRRGWCAGIRDAETGLMTIPFRPAARAASGSRAARRRRWRAARAAAAGGAAQSPSSAQAPRRRRGPRKSKPSAPHREGRPSGRGDARASPRSTRAPRGHDSSARPTLRITWVRERLRAGSHVVWPRCTQADHRAVLMPARRGSQVQRRGMDEALSRRRNDSKHLTVGRVSETGHGFWPNQKPLSGVFFSRRGPEWRLAAERRPRSTGHSGRERLRTFVGDGGGSRRAKAAAPPQRLRIRPRRLRRAWRFRSLPASRPCRGARLPGGPT